ncbi:MAG TPA: HEAT repeat domain-containing protein [Thermoanaerobaculia bacterium]|jgi:hypothetical protein
MDCRHALKVRELALARLAGSPATEADETFLASHVASCAPCRAEVDGMSAVWTRLGEDDGADLAVSPTFEARTTAAMAAIAGAAGARAGNAGNVVLFPARQARENFLKAAAVLLAGGLGFLVARGTDRPASFTATTALPTPSSRAGEQVALVSNRTVDASRAALDLSGKPRLANVAYRASDEPGKIAVSFDVTTRYTVVGRPEDRGIADLLVSLMSGAAETEGAKGKVLDFVSATTREGAAVSPEIVNLLRRTLETDKNPGVRKKAAEALVQMPPSLEIRDALARALKADTNPSVRILAVEGLAKAATVLKDQSTIETLRQKAGDDRENGYVRSQAALALKRIEI